MRSWYLLMAAFLMILAIMAFLLGFMEHPDKTATAGNGAKTGWCTGTPESAPCPLRLDSISIRTNDGEEGQLSLKDNPGKTALPQG